MNQFIRMEEDHDSEYPSESMPLTMASTENGHMLFLESAITKQTINPITRKIMEINMFDPTAEHITLFITSPGGDLYSAISLIDIMEMSEIPIRTIGLGQIASAGLLIFMCGHDRIISRSTEVMSHEATFNAEQFSAKMTDFNSYQSMFKNLSRRVIDIYVEKTGKDEKYVKKFMLNNSDTYLTAAQAIEFGFADSYLHDHKDIFWDMLGKVVPVEAVEVEEIDDEVESE